MLCYAIILDCECQPHWSHSCHNHLFCNISSVISDFNLPVTDAQANPCLTSTFRCLSQFETSFFAFQLLWDLTYCQYHAKGFIFSGKSSFKKWCAWFDEEEKWINESWMPVFSGNCAKSTIKLGVCLHCLDTWFLSSGFTSVLFIFRMEKYRPLFQICCQQLNIEIYES